MTQTSKTYKIQKQIEWGYTWKNAGTVAGFKNALAAAEKMLEQNEVKQVRLTEVGNSAWSYLPQHLEVGFSYS